ncbi:hypothetical protein Tco_1517036 [Tanacetum coccineum]
MTTNKISSSQPCGCLMIQTGCPPKAPMLAAVFMANLSSTSATKIQSMRYHQRMNNSQKPDMFPNGFGIMHKQFFEQQYTIFDELEAEYEQCVLDNKNLTIEKKNLLIKNDCLIAECLEKDICSIVLSSDIVVPPSSNCLCEDLRSACDREHTKVLELEAEVLKQQKMVIESEKRNSHLQKTHIDLQLKFQNYKQFTEGSCDQQAQETCLNSVERYELPSLRIQLMAFVIRSLKSVNTKTPHAKHSVNHTKKVWKATRNHNVNTTKTAWRPTGKIIGSVKPQWKPTGRHFALYDNCPLTRIVESPNDGWFQGDIWSKGRTVADSIAERLTRPTAYKFKTDCSIIPVWVF